MNDNATRWMVVDRRRKPIDGFRNLSKVIAQEDAQNLSRTLPRDVQPLSVVPDPQ